MFCKNCGKEVNDEAVVCIHCGCSIDGKKAVNADHNESKSGLGVLMGLLLGLIGLIIGYVMYPEGTVARKTFIKAWIITFCVTTGVGVLFSVIYVVAFAMYFPVV